MRARQDRLDDAKDALHTALALDPKNTCGTYRQLGWICIADQHYQDATAAFTAAVHNDAHDAAAWYGLAEACRATEQFTEALHAIGEALKLRREWSHAVALRKRILGEQINLSMKLNLLDFRTVPQPLPPPRTLPDETHAPASRGADYAFAMCSFAPRVTFRS